MTKTLKFYRWLTSHLKTPLQKMVQRRLKKGKEDPDRITERYGVASLERPDGRLIWLHAASVGETQSALILIETLLQRFDNLHILVTSGTRTSAELMQKKLPPRAFHQYYPLDHPEWVNKFLNFWAPDLALWMESEFWPNMLTTLKSKKTPTILVNGRLSNRSFARWSYFKTSIQYLLNSFSIILAQTDQDSARFKDLGAPKVITTDNLKYSAKKLPVDNTALNTLSAQLSGRTTWLYASSHDGEEELACRLHIILKKAHPDLLTIIVPRHPERGEEIYKLCTKSGLTACLRGQEKALPEEKTDIYIANTLGELGLFYRLTPLACIGRSFSNDGGGGHNPVEAAQLHCAVLHGPHVQYQQDIYDDMHKNSAALQIQDEKDFINTLQKLFSSPKELEDLQQAGLKFSNQKTDVIHRVMNALEPTLQHLENKGIS